MPVVYCQEPISQVDERFQKNGRKSQLLRLDVDFISCLFAEFQHSNTEQNTFTFRQLRTAIVL